MKAIVTFYKQENGKTVYDENGKPATTKKEVDFPLRFSYGSFNEEKKVFSSFGTVCDVMDIISIDILNESSSN